MYVSVVIGGECVFVCTSSQINVLNLRPSDCHHHYLYLLIDSTSKLTSSEREKKGEEMRTWQHENERHSLEEFLKEKKDHQLNEWKTTTAVVNDESERKTHKKKKTLSLHTEAYIISKNYLNLSREKTHLIHNCKYKNMSILCDWPCVFSSSSLVVHNATTMTVVAAEEVEKEEDLRFLCLVINNWWHLANLDMS